MGSRKSKASRTGNPSTPRSRRGLFWALALIAPAGIALLWFRDPAALPVAPVPMERSMQSDEAVFAAYAGSASCRECHEAAFELWQESNHRFAERSLRESLDKTAFDPPHIFQHGTQTSETRFVEGRFELITQGYDGDTGPYEAERIFGHDPLRQLLIPGPRGRLQATEVAYDPHKNEWFDVYGDEDRQPGEWGHWTGRGMNWNSMCASCHNTRLRKNYDEATDTYATSRAEMSVGCEACHGPMQDHVLWRGKHPDAEETDPTVIPMSKTQYMEACGPCHSRRSELTGEFVPGDRYFDHYGLVLPDETDLYFSDGQVMGENYVFTSFLSSRMYAAGVHCTDCHQYHSTKTLLPGNLLCMRCHDGNYENSPVIDEATHSFHEANNAGYQCVGCHMPHTTYMQRHPRRDHGFTIPDPRLTKTLGIPNACNRCHADKGVDWSIDYVDQWYGDRMQRHSRDRAEWIAAARAGQPEGRDRLLAMLTSEDLPFWQAVAAGMLDQWVMEPAVSRALIGRLAHTNALVRSQAARTLEPPAQQGDLAVQAALKPLLNDPLRNVRVNAAWSLRQEIALDSLAGRELLHFLSHVADQPTGALQQGILYLAQQRPDRAFAYIDKAIAWEPNSALIYHEKAVASSLFGRPQEALRAIQKACDLEPQEAEYRYKLGLAWNELGRLDKTLEALQKTVELDPAHARAWYNLGLALNADGKPDAAIEALLRGESAQSRDPRIPYALATILLQADRMNEARSALARALEIQPDFEAARNLLRQVSP